MRLIKLHFSSATYTLIPYMTKSQSVALRHTHISSRCCQIDTLAHQSGELFGILNENAYAQQNYQLQGCVVRATP